VAADLAVAADHERADRRHRAGTAGELGDPFDAIVAARTTRTPAKSWDAAPRRPGQRRINPA